MRVVALADISLFTNDTTPARALCKLPKRWTWTPCRKRERGGSFCHGLFADQTEIKGLEFLREASVNEPAGGIVSEAGITDSVSAFPECLRRILTENVIAANGNDSAAQQIVHDATNVVDVLSQGRYCRSTVLAAGYLFCALDSL